MEARYVHVLMRPLLLIGVMWLAGCSRSGESAAEAAGAAVSNAPGSLLAYEHDVQIVLDQQQIAARLKASQQACTEERFGQCSVLEVGQQGGDAPQARLTVRMAPEGVEPFIAQAAQGADIGSRSTRAEDLAQAVGNNAQLQDRLNREHARLLEFMQRRDLAVADMIALSKQLAEVEAQLQSAQQDGAQHRRRIDTQRITLEFVPPGGQSGRSAISQSLRDVGATLSSSTAILIQVVAWLLPFAVAFVLVWRVMRRWRHRKAQATSSGR